MEKINFNKIKKDDKINNIPEGIVELHLIERKKKVKEDLKNQNIKQEELKILLLCDNTNADLIYKYILSLDEEQSFSEILKYSNYLSIKKIEQLRLNISAEFDLFFRKIPFKVLFFNFLFSLENLNESTLDYQIGVLKTSIKQRVINNQPYDVDNLEALYYYFCVLLSKQIEGNKIKKVKYFD